jgi:hypothetical protein
MGLANNKIDGDKKIHIKRWQFQWPCGYGGAMRVASPN